MFVFVVQGPERSWLLHGGPVFGIFPGEAVSAVEREDGSSIASVSLQSALLTGMAVSKDCSLVVNGLGSGSKADS